ncbi:hypothetical protein ACWCPM_32715 [Streptomyces sp. NPDC002309]
MVFARRLDRALAFSGHERGDECVHLDLVEAAGGAADGGAAIGVASKDDGPVDTRHQMLDVIGVAGQPAQRATGGHPVFVFLQLLDDAVPAGSVCEHAVHEDDGCLLCCQEKDLHFVPGESALHRLKTDQPPDA